MSTSLNMRKHVECPNQSGRPSKSETNATSQRKNASAPSFPHRSGS